MERIFFGAGMSFTSGIPTAGDLLARARQSLQLTDAAKKEETIWKLAEACEKDADLYKSFKKCVAEALTTSTYNITPEYKMLAFLIGRSVIRAAYTTNQDTLLEYVLEKQGIPYNRYTHKSESYAENVNGHFDIIKLCGDIHDPYNMCFSGNEIEAVVERKAPVWVHLVGQIGQGIPFVFLGYSFYKDALGNALVETVSRQDKNVIVDPFLNERHLEITDQGNVHITSSAESYFESEIREMRPELHVKHILYNANGVGGVQTYYYSLKKLLEETKQPIRFSECSTEKYYESEAKTEKKDNSFGFTYLRATAMSQTYQCVAEEKFDIIHAHDFISAYTATELGMPVVYTSHSLESDEMECLKHKGEEEKVEFVLDDAKRYEDSYYPAIPRLLALSKSYIKSLPEGVKHSALKVSAPFILPQEGQFTELSPTPLDKGKGNVFKKDKFTIAYFGRATYRKGIDILNRALNGIGGRDFQVLFVGPEITADGSLMKIVMVDGAYGTAARKLYVDECEADFVGKAFSLRLDMGDIPFDEHLRKLWSAYRLADAVVIPSRYEPFGYVALEALAMKKFVIASDVGGLHEILESNRGHLVDISDQENAHKAFGNAIRWAMDNRDAVENICRNGYAWVKEQYTKEKLDALSEQMYDIYLSAVLYGNKHSLESCKRSYDALRRQFENILSGKTKWKEILLAAAKEYRNIRRSGNETGEEYYDLFWEIARWIKQLRPMCPEVRIISHKSLAELITQVERILPK